MPAFTEEITHAKEEGINIIPNSYVAECVENGDIKVVLNKFDSKDNLLEINCDYIVIAIGQQGNVEEYAVIGNENLSKGNKIKADKNKIGRASCRERV